VLERAAGDVAVRCRERGLGSGVGSR
jgi:hypothetical protein